MKKRAHKKYLIIGKYLKEKREAAGLSQEAVGKLIGHSSPQFVSCWERGVVRPPLASLSILTKAYKLNPKKFIKLLLKAEETDLREVLGWQTRGGTEP